LGPNIFLVSQFFNEQQKYIRKQTTNFGFGDKEFALLCTGWVIVMVE